MEEDIREKIDKLRYKIINLDSHLRLSKTIIGTSPNGAYHILVSQLNIMKAYLNILISRLQMGEE